MAVERTAAATGLFDASGSWSLWRLASFQTGAVFRRSDWLEVRVVQPGSTRIERADGSIEPLNATASADMRPRDVFVIETPGGGGFGGGEIVLVLSGIAVIVIASRCALNPLLVVMTSVFVTGLAAGFDLHTIVAAFGKAFNDTRFISMAWAVLPVIGLLERYGLQERARGLMASLKGATAGRLLIAYLLIRQIGAGLGLTSVAGHAQTVRPLVVPMAEAAAEQQAGALTDQTREQVKAMAAATDNIGLFFGEDMFIAIGSILLMKALLETYGIILEPLQLSVWAIPTAIAAFAIHAFRLWRFDRALKGRAA